MESRTSTAPSDPPVDSDDAYQIRWLMNLPFWIVHVLAVLGIAVMGWSWSGFALAIGLYYLRLFGITAGYHRYFSHRSFKTSRFMQAVFGLLGVITTQKGPLWWASHHRRHHKYSDQPEDVHSPPQRGFWWSQFGWILVNRHHETEWHRIKDLSKYPELRFMNRYCHLFDFAFALTLFLLGGAHALLWGYFVSVVLAWHGTFTINSLAHVWGRRRYKTGDESRNNFILAILTMGEGWHNNHHHYQRSASQGFYWWEIDMTFYILKVMSWVGLVWDLHTVPKHVRDQTPRRKSDERDPENSEQDRDLAAAA